MEDREIAQLQQKKKEELAAFTKDNPEEVTQIFVSLSMGYFDLNLLSDLEETVVPTMPWL